MSVALLTALIAVLTVVATTSFLYKPTVVMTCSLTFRKMTFVLEIENTNTGEMDDKQATLTLHHHNHTKKIAELNYRHANSDTILVSLCDIHGESVINVELSSSDDWRVENVSVSFWMNNSKLTG